MCDFVKSKPNPRYLPRSGVLSPPFLLVKQTYQIDALTLPEDEEDGGGVKFPHRLQTLSMTK
jgi:hypothetical protein